MSITWDVWPLVPFLVRCVVCLQFTPTVFCYNWVAFLKSSSSFDFQQWKKRSQRKTEIVIDGRSICHSWQCFQLASLVTWIVTFSAQSEQVSTNVLSFNQLIINHLKDFILDDIQTTNFLPFRLYYIILSRSRSPKRRHQDYIASSLLFFFGHCRMRARARGRTAKPRETRDDWYIFCPILVFMC